MAKLDVCAVLLTSADATHLILRSFQIFPCRAQLRADRGVRSTVIRGRGPVSDGALASRADAVATVLVAIEPMIASMAAVKAFAVGVVPAPITQS